MKTTYILGTKINHDITYSDVLKTVEDSYLRDGKSHQICTTNPEFVIEGLSDSLFRDVVNSSDLSLADGSGILYAIKYFQSVSTLKKNKWNFLLKGLSIGLSKKVMSAISSEKIVGVDLTFKLCELASQKNYTIFMLGGRSRNWRGIADPAGVDIATLAANQLRKVFPNVQIIGSTSDFSPSPKDDALTVKMIQESIQKHRLSHVDFLFVACQHWDQEKWIARNASKIPAKVSMGVGGTFDIFASNRYAPGSSYVKKHNIEWIYKLIKQPFRYKRILKAFPEFPLRVYLSSLRS